MASLTRCMRIDGSGPDDLDTTALYDLVSTVNHDWVWGRPPGSLVLRRILTSRQFDPYGKDMYWTTTVVAEEEENWEHGVQHPQYLRRADWSVLDAATEPGRYPWPSTPA